MPQKSDSTTEALIAARQENVELQKRIRELSERADFETLQSEIKALQFEKDSQERTNTDLLAQLDAKNRRIVEL